MKPFELPSIAECRCISKYLEPFAPCSPDFAYDDPSRQMRAIPPPNLYSGWLDSFWRSVFANVSLESSLAAVSMMGALHFKYLGLCKYSSVLGAPVCTTTTPRLLLQDTLTFHTSYRCLDTYCSSHEVMLKNVLL